MTACQGHTTMCDGLDLQPVRLGLRREVLAMCAGCRHSASAMGAVVRIVERRVADVPVARERRLRRPEWLARLTARDETGRVVAP